MVVYERMLEQAMVDGIITEDERSILEEVRKRYGIYKGSLDRAYQDGIITDVQNKRLRELRKGIYKNALRRAYEDQVITSDERALLDVLKEVVGLDSETIDMLEWEIEEKDSAMERYKLLFEELEKM